MQKVRNHQWSKLEDMPGDKYIAYKSKEHREGKDTVAVKRDRN